MRNAIVKRAFGAVCLANLLTVLVPGASVWRGCASLALSTVSAILCGLEIGSMKPVDLALCHAIAAVSIAGSLIGVDYGALALMVACAGAVAFEWLVRSGDGAGPRGHSEGGGKGVCLPQECREHGLLLLRGHVRPGRWPAPRAAPAQPCRL